MCALKSAAEVLFNSIRLIQLCNIIMMLCILEFIIFSMTVQHAAGHFDKGSPQHRITWGRGNTHTSTFFGDTLTNVSAVVGHRARLPCQVKNLGQKDLSWIRQRDLHILTTGLFTYTSDDRFKVYHPENGDDWFLDISSVTFRDAGIYECQISVSPKVSLPVTLNVLEVQHAKIPGLKEMYIQTGSTISLICEVPASTDIIGSIHWFHGSNTLNYSSIRGGISMELEKTPSSTTSKLYITRATKSDSGNYTCAPKYANSGSVLVHVVNAGEESAAAVQSGCSSYLRNQNSKSNVFGFILQELFLLLPFFSALRFSFVFLPIS